MLLSDILDGLLALDHLNLTVEPGATITVSVDGGGLGRGVGGGDVAVGGGGLVGVAALMGVASRMGGVWVGRAGGKIGKLGR